MQYIIVLVLALAWLTHVVFSLQQMSIGLLFIGALVFPIGVIHGFMIWLGVA